MRTFRCDLGRVRYRTLAAQCVRAARGSLSQAAVNRRLGYRGNQVYRWEKGLQSMDWPGFVKLCRLRKLPIDDCMRRHLQVEHDAADSPALIAALVGESKLGEIARKLGVSRFTLSRWLQGTTTPALDDVLHFIQLNQLAVVEFLDDLLGAGQLPELALLHRQKGAERTITYQYPFAAAVLRCLELKSYEALPRHTDEFLAERIGVSPKEVGEVLGLLVECGSVEQVDGKYRTLSKTMDTRGDFEGTRAIRLYWISRGERFLRGLERPPERAYFGHNVFSVSREAREKISEEYFRFFQKAREIVQNDFGTPEEVSVLQVMLYDLGVEGAVAKGSEERS